MPRRLHQPARPVPTLTDCGPRCLARLLQQAGKPADLARLTRACGTDPRGTTLDGLQRAAQKAGLAATALKVDGAFLARERPRGLAWVERDHFVCFEAESGGTARVWDPNGETTVSQSWDRLARHSQGVVLLVAADKTALPKL